MSTYANIQSLFRRRYAKYINPLPSADTLAKEMPFVPQNVRPGEDYRFPVQMSLEHGVSHSVSNTAFSVSSVVDSQTEAAALDGATILLAGNIPYDVIAKAMNGESAYFGAMDYKVKALMAGAELYRELSLGWGGGTGAAASASIASINASISGADLGAGQVINITRATWSAGLWNLMTNARVDLLQSDGDTSRETEVIVSAVTLATNRVTLTKSGSAAVAAAGDLIIVRGGEDATCYGLKAILENTGTMHGISAAAYPQWQSLSISAGSGVLTVAKITEMGALLSRNGLKKGGTLWAAPETFADLVKELQDHDRYNNPGGDKKSTGFNALLVKTSCGPIEIKNYFCQQQGFAFFIASGVGHRVGSTDLTFSLPGTNKWFYVELESNAGCQIRMFSNQAPVLEIPYHCAIINNIQNNADTAPA